MHMTIVQPGPLTSVQDAGRFGYLAYGVGESGVMDHDSYQKANALVGNKHGEAVLEATLMGPAIQFDEEAVIAYMGADMQARTEEFMLERGRPYRIEPGQTVTFGMAKNGVRAYISVAGGINVPKVMDSRATNMKCKIGGFEGRKLAANDVLPVADQKRSILKTKVLLKRRIEPAIYEKTKRVHVVLGPQEEYFTPEGIKTFLKTEYVVSPESDRMGIRLGGAVIEGRDGMDIISDGIVFGSVQVTSAGLPIILMADHQTTGGYAKIATVLTEDLAVLAQAAPGDRICFEEVTL